MTSEKLLRKHIREVIISGGKEPLNEFTGILKWLKDFLGPIADAYLNAQADAYEAQQKKAQKAAQQALASSGVEKPKPGVLKNKDDENFAKYANALAGIQNEMQKSINADIDKAASVKTWQPSDDTDEARKEWSNSEDGKNSLALFDAAGSLAALLKIAIDMGEDEYKDHLAKFNAQDDPSPIETANWIKDGFEVIVNSKAKYDGAEGIDDSIVDKAAASLADLNGKMGSIISTISSETKEAASEDPDFKKESSKEITDKQYKDLQFISDTFTIDDDLDEIKSNYTNAVEYSVAAGFVDKSEAKMKLKDGLAGIDEYIKSEGKEGLDKISNLGTEKLGSEKLAIRGKTKTSLDIIIRKAAGKASGKGGGSGSEAAESVIKTIQTTISQKRTPWTEEQLDTINNTIKKSNAPIFLKGFSGGELIGFKYQEDKLYGLVLQGGDREGSTPVTKSNVNDIALSEIRKYIRGILIKEYFSR